MRVARHAHDQSRARAHDLDGEFHIAQTHANLLASTHGDEIGVSRGEDVQADLRHARRDPDHILFGDPDVVKFIGMISHKPTQPAQHSQIRRQQSQIVYAFCALGKPD